VIKIAGHIKQKWEVLMGNEPYVTAVLSSIMGKSSFFLS
jgi:hypothetical protein